MAHDAPHLLREPRLVMPEIPQEGVAEDDDLRRHLGVRHAGPVVEAVGADGTAAIADHHRHACERRGELFRQLVEGGLHERCERRIAHHHRIA